MSIERNEKCPCLSGKKHKKCYLMGSIGECLNWKADNTTEIAEDYRTQEEKVLEFLMGCITEVSNTFETIDSSYIRVRAVVSFTLADVFSNYLYEFLGRPEGTGTPGKRFKFWIEKYCFNDKNSDYCDELKKITAEDLCDLRNSVVHFFGTGSNNDIILANGELEGEYKKRITRALSKYSLSFVNINNLYLLFLNGAQLMIGDWRDMDSCSEGSENKKSFHEGIKHVYLKYSSEGAVVVKK